MNANRKWLVLLFSLSSWISVSRWTSFDCIFPGESIFHRNFVGGGKGCEEALKRDTSISSRMSINLISIERNGNSAPVLMRKFNLNSWKRRFECLSSDGKHKLSTMSSSTKRIKWISMAATSVASVENTQFFRKVLHLLPSPPKTIHKSTN